MRKGTVPHPARQSHTTSLVTAVLLVSAFFAAPLDACEGEDYERTIAIVQYSQQAGYRCGMSADPMGCLNREMEIIVTEINSLPPSCQQLLDSMAQPAPPAGGGTMCQGGVCCDDTGCYY